MKRVAIYARMSSVRKRGDQSEADALELLGTAGVDRQVADCRQKALDENLSVVAEFVDNNRSAYDRRKKRPEWEKLKLLIADGAIEGIVVWHADRLYRHPGDVNEIIDLIETGAGLEIFACQSGRVDLNTSAGKMVARIMGDVSWQEVEHKAERQSRQILETAKQGLSHGGPIPVGYKRGAHPGERVIDDEQAAILREAARRYLEDGASLNAITMYARDELKRPKLKPISMKDMLTRPAVIGLRQHVPVAVRNRHNAKRANGKATGEVPAMVAQYPASWEPIFDEETHARLMARLFNPKNSRGGRPQLRSLLAGVLECGSCGARMSFSTKSYKCSTNSGGCGKVSISASGIENSILGFMPTALGTGTLTLNESDPVDESKDRQMLSRLEKKRREYHELYKNDFISLDDLRTHLNDLNLRISIIEVSHSEASRQEAAKRQVVNGMAHWESASREEKRSIIRSLFRKIVVMPSAKGKNAGCNLDLGRIHLHIGDAILENSDYVVMRSDTIPPMPDIEIDEHNHAFRQWQQDMAELTD
ncbi:recombinase family protein [Cryobacterium algoritolerans]|uniref:Recombinase family protein n=1 Tax=Cryobacterium algoritolerans TaxID=1259184 RepID=A0A4R8WHJ0_9MICO|nr:recombinase family protein [Cryobacterium algoritolerans]TFC09875.1 recombinase family protein [Cryobacterium algoritolerans]